MHSLSLALVFAFGLLLGWLIASDASDRCPDTCPDCCVKND